MVTVVQLNAIDNTADKDPQIASVDNLHMNIEKHNCHFVIWKSFAVQPELKEKLRMRRFASLSCMDTNVA